MIDLDVGEIVIDKDSIQRLDEEEFRDLVAALLDHLEITAIGRWDYGGAFEFDRVEDR